MEEENARERAMPLVRVAIDRSVEGEGLTYASPWHDIRMGEQVEVPLGRVKARGVVVARGGDELLEGIERGRVRRLLARSGTGLSEELVALGRWIASYYVTPLGMVLASMVPAAVKQRTGSRMVEVVDRQPEDVEREALEQVRLTPSARAAWERIVELGRVGLPAEPKGLARDIGTTLGPINRLVAAGLLRRFDREEIRARGFQPATEGREEVPEEAKPRPNEEQRAAIEGIAGTLGGFVVHLLFGVTGSGKTEVYLRLIERVLAEGKTALVLVPEISLTPQTALRFRQRFGELVAVLHSGLSASQRHEQWELASSGRARVVVGARSAVFAPLQSLGLVVVDEEHDGSYKQDTLPRYHGRDVAIKRAQLANCPVVLGSATPSLESWSKSTGEGAKYRLWTLRKRAGAGALPSVRVVDLAAEQPSATAGGAGRGPLMIGATLRGALERTLKEGGQAILLLNRRGFATFMHCPVCKWTLSCRDCDAAMVMHKGRELPKGELVRCHHCLAEQRVPEKCPSCGSRVMGLGVGTQRVEEELTALLSSAFPDESVPEMLVRIDADTVKSVRELHEALGRFGTGKARVLLGTQMIAKGLDFPNVRLVGVVSADTALNLPDFRAGERTFQLVAQVAGRAGRGEHPGTVIVQSFSPLAAPVRLAAQHDYEGFATEELELRRRAGLPPAWRMARIVVRDEDPTKGHARAEELGAMLRAEAERLWVEWEAESRIDGPVPSAIARIGGWHRWDILVRAPRPGVVQRILGSVRALGRLVSDQHTAVDVDPVAVL